MRKNPRDKMRLCNFWILLLISGGTFADVTQKVDLYFPTPILEGEDLTMNCKFKVDKNSSIYQVKWYKGNREIFRFQPKEYPPTKSLPFTEARILIDEKGSDLNRLVVRKVPLALRGNVSCEVTWEPSFKTIIATKPLQIVALAKGRPFLNVECHPKRKSYSSSGVETISVKLQDTLIANCSSRPSNPAQNITFIINSEIYSSPMEISSEVVEGENKTEIRKMSLQLQLRHRHFVKQKIRLRCVSSLYNLHNAISDEFEAELLKEIINPSGYGGINNGVRNLKYIDGLIWSIALTNIWMCQLLK